jgi:hypothetical protein
LFAGIGFPHRYDPAATISLGPNYDDHPSCEEADCDRSCLAVVDAIVSLIDGHPREDIRGVGEVEPSLVQRQGALGRIEGDLHELLYIQKMLGIAMLDMPGTRA